MASGSRACIHRFCRCRLHGVMPQHADALVNAALKQWGVPPCHTVVWLSHTSWTGVRVWRVASCRRWMRQREEDGGGGWQEGMHALLLGGRSPLLPELHGRRITALKSA